MPNETDGPAIAELRDTPSDTRKAVQEKLDRIAEKAATRAGNRQQRYEGEHGIFTK
jgi:hypothetical protein